MWMLLCHVLSTKNAGDQAHPRRATTTPPTNTHITQSIAFTDGAEFMTFMFLQPPQKCLCLKSKLFPYFSWTLSSNVITSKYYGKNTLTHKAIEWKFPFAVLILLRLTLKGHQKWKHLCLHINFFDLS